MKKENIKRIIVAAVTVIVVLYFVRSIPFNSDIKKEIAAYVYKDGIVSGLTTVRMDGKMGRFIFSDIKVYIGIFCIDYYSRTCREETKISISWGENPDYGYQQLLYFQPGVLLPSLEINRSLLIDEELNEFALGFKDGTIIATSRDYHDSYVRADL